MGQCCMRLRGRCCGLWLGQAGEASCELQPAAAGIAGYLGCCAAGRMCQGRWWCCRVQRASAPSLHTPQAPGTSHSPRPPQSPAQCGGWWPRTVSRTCRGRRRACREAWCGSDGMLEAAVGVRVGGRVGCGADTRPNTGSIAGVTNSTISISTSTSMYLGRPAPPAPARPAPAQAPATRPPPTC